MSNIPSDLKYTTSHEWVRNNDDGTFTVGITDHAQEMLGDLVHIELPDVDAEFDAVEGIAVAESVKAASDIYSPVNGTVTAVNESVLDDPELVNTDPYGEGWLFTLRVDEEEQVEALMDATTYADTLEDE